MKNLDHHSITDEVISRHAEASSPRVREIMTALVRHLHDFARDVKLTEAEWFEGIQFLTRTGQICDDKRQEFILLSDTLGLSMLVTAMNNAWPKGCTESTVFGPFFVANSATANNGDDIANGAKGAPCYVDTRLVTPSGEPIAGATVEVWMADEDGFYDVQYPEDTLRARATFSSDAQGRVYFWSILAEAYPIPDDGPVGQMLKALGRHPWRPAHLHFRIQAPGCHTLVTHVFRNGGQYLDSDTVFGVRSSLIADWVRHDPGIAPDGRRREQPYYTLNFDFVLAPQSALRA